MCVNMTCTECNKPAEWILLPEKVLFCGDHGGPQSTGWMSVAAYEAIQRGIESAKTEPLVELGRSFAEYADDDLDICSCASLTHPPDWCHEGWRQAFALVWAAIGYRNELTKLGLAYMSLLGQATGQED